MNNNGVIHQSQSSLRTKKYYSTFEFKLSGESLHTDLW